VLGCNAVAMSVAILLCGGGVRLAGSSARMSAIAIYHPEHKIAAYGPPPPPPPGKRPKDCPCITWKFPPQQCNTLARDINLDDYLPSIYSAYVWHGAAAGCTKCSGSPGDFYCAYIFPCFAVGPGVNIWGHHDTLNRGVMMGNIPCNAERPPAPGSNQTDGSDGATCPQWWAGKGPEWERFGWQLAQSGAKPQAHAGQLIEYDGYILARDPQASPYPNCGPGNVGWVPYLADGTLGCMHQASNAVTSTTCNGFEVRRMRL
jgi:hypothetical protein